MRRCGCLGLVLLLACASSLANADESGWVADYNHLLADYVVPGGVRYAEWKANPGDMKTIDVVVNAIANEQVASLDRNTQLAFYLNAYNAWILHEALAKYPAASVKDPLFTFFFLKRIKVAGEEMSFDHLERKIIREKFGEPRIHFALNCASRSCPPLQPEAFEGEKLDPQLERLTKAFVNSDRGVVYIQSSNVAALSKIFDWYKDDFGKEGGAVAFINKRRLPPLPADAKITFQDYDWSLNDAK